MIAKNGTIKYLSIFWRKPLINCEINLQLKQSKNCFLVAGTVANQVPTFTTLSTQDNAKLLEQFKSGFKSTINRNTYQSKKLNQGQNQYLIDPSFEGVNSLFVLSFENENSQ